MGIVMMTASSMRIAVAAIVVAIQVNGHGQQVGDRGDQSTVTLCKDVTGCLPVWTSTIVVYVADSGGAAIADAHVAVRHAVAKAQAVEERLVADEHGMAAVSVLPHSQVSLRVAASGFLAATMDDMVVEPGRLQVVKVRLAVDVNALR
jgi:hypothetical protein